MTMDQKQSDIVSAFEQAETAYCAIARLVASYHAELLKSGIGNELSAELTHSFQENLLQQVAAASNARQ